MMEDYKFTVLWKNDIMADIELYDKRRKVRIKKYKNTFPENLKGLGIEKYNPYKIVMITHGVMWEDFQWIRFPGVCTLYASGISEKCQKLFFTTPGRSE